MPSSNSRLPNASPQAVSLFTVLVLQLGSGCLFYTSFWLLLFFLHVKISHPYLGNSMCTVAPQPAPRAAFSEKDFRNYKTELPTQQTKGTDVTRFLNFSCKYYSFSLCKVLDITQSLGSNGSKGCKSLIMEYSGRQEGRTGEPGEGKESRCWFQSDLCLQRHGSIITSTNRGKNIISISV